MHDKTCNQCNQKYKTKDKRQKYCSKKCYDETKKGKGNPFYGKKHKKSSLESMKKKLSQCFSGEKNPFYGKHHTKENLDKIKKANKEYYENNKESLLEKRLQKKNLTKNKIEVIWEEYKNGPYNNDWIMQISGVDCRTFKKFVIDLEIASSEDVVNIGEKKKLFQGSGISYPEIVLLGLLENEFGKNVVKHQVKKFGFYYDFQVRDKFLIEYDGYYFHKILKNNNDHIKEKLAEDNGYILIRIEEDENRKVSFIEELKKIKNIIEEKDEI